MHLKNLKNTFYMLRIVFYRAQASSHSRSSLVVPRLHSPHFPSHVVLSAHVQSFQFICRRGKFCGKWKRCTVGKEILLPKLEEVTLN